MRNKTRDEVLRTSRRRLLQSGALLVPTIVTLRARSALAIPPEGHPLNPLPVLNQQYSAQQYSYGDNMGETTWDFWQVNPSQDAHANYNNVYYSHKLEKWVTFQPTN